MIDVASLQRQIVQKLRAAGIAAAPRIAEELLCCQLRCERSALWKISEDRVLAAVVEQLQQWVERVVAGEPYEQILGEVLFYGARIAISSDVLIPRPETELLVDKACSYLSTLRRDGLRVWDICCGSGCLGIAVKRRFPELEVVLSDLSSKALSVARSNCSLNQVDILCREGDFLEPFAEETAHCILCNPPYLAESEFASLDRSVRDFEPKAALVSGTTGLEFYERAAALMPAYLVPGGKVFFEIGASQGSAVKKLFENAAWSSVLLERDWSGMDRFVIATAAF